MKQLTSAPPWLEWGITGLLAGGLVGWGMFRVLQRADNRPQLIVKWLLTVLVGGWVIWKAGLLRESEASWTHVIVALVGGLCLAALWRRSIASVFAKPFTALYDGGDAEIEPQPYYSVTEAKRKRGRYAEAVAEARKQLDRFPTDFTGQMMIAEIQAENLNDLPGAEVTIQRLCEQPGHAPRNIALALGTLADWHLKYGLDREAAQQDLEQIIARLPGTEFALSAEQRIAHLATREQMLAPHERKVYAVPE